MKKFLKFGILVGILAISLCGCADDKMENSLSEGENVVLNNADIKNISEDSNDESGEAIADRIEDTEGGVLYSTMKSDFQADMVLGDNYFATQIADIMLNFDLYVGKTIEIEGFSLSNSFGYTFVGRYSENAICPDCPTGYTFLEYEWHGNEKLDLGNEQTWIKVKGELKKGNDGVDYYYIDAYSIEVMDEWGIATVQN